MFVLQAWAFTMGVRLVLNKVPFMNMENFEKSIWVLHRKLFHRFLKYIKYFRKATTELPEYQQAIQDEIHFTALESTARGTHTSVPVPACQRPLTVPRSKPAQGLPPSLSEAIFCLWRPRFNSCICACCSHLVCCRLESVSEARRGDVFGPLFVHHGRPWVEVLPAGHPRVRSGVTRYS